LRNHLRKMYKRLGILTTEWQSSCICIFTLFIYLFSISSAQQLHFNQCYHIFSIFEQRRLHIVNFMSEMMVMNFDKSFIYIKYNLIIQL
jgi:hypothetical protein